MKSLGEKTSNFFEKTPEDAYEKASTETETEKELSVIQKDAEESINKIGKQSKYFKKNF